MPMNLEHLEFLRSLPRLSRREATGHKGTYGTVLGIGGSRGMAGAAALAGRAALLGGVGLVRLAVPDPLLETVAGFYPETMTVPCPADRKGRFAMAALPIWLDQAASATCVMIGPGLGRSAALDSLVRRFLEQLDKPCVIDADALNALASFGRPLAIPRPTHAAVRIFTPHPGEFARLRSEPTPPESEPKLRQKAALDFAARHHVTLVLKGHATLVAEPERISVNRSGNPGMATGGSGDVLTGLLAALLAQGLSPWDAARLGVYLHGAAGDLAAEQSGEPSVTATAILRHIPPSLQSLR